MNLSYRFTLKFCTVIKRRLASNLFTFCKNSVKQLSVHTTAIINFVIVHSFKIFISTLLSDSLVQPFCDKCSATCQNGIIICKVFLLKNSAMVCNFHSLCNIFAKILHLCNKMVTGISNPATFCHNRQVSHPICQYSICGLELCSHSQQAISPPRQCVQTLADYLA